jgi:hypothetical protein
LRTHEKQENGTSAGCRLLRKLANIASSSYDFPNHPNLSAPNFTPTSSQFGEIASKTGLNRQLQLSLRFYLSGAANPGCSRLSGGFSEAGKAR